VLDALMIKLLLRNLDLCNVLAFNFDLQAVLEVPRANTGPICYKRKLATYNLCAFNLLSHEGHCFMWAENTAGRGSIEIASCIFKHIGTQLSLNPDITSIKMMSDSCGGQNRNNYFATMCMYAVEHYSQLQEIDHRFFEPGHSEMECDSMHSMIERHTKPISMWIPHDWVIAAALARTNPEPYTVVEMEQKDFKDFKDLSKVLIKNRTIGDDGVVNWMQIKWFHFEKQSPRIMFFKTNLEADTPFQRLDVTNAPSPQTPRPARRGRMATRNVPVTQYSVDQAYKTQIPISKAKLQDLKSLCKDLIIPQIFHEFYNGLVDSADVRDTVPETDVEED